MTCRFVSNLCFWRQYARFSGRDILPASGSSPNVFGTMKKKNVYKWDEGDKEVVEFIDGIEGKTRLKPIQYAKMIKKFISERKLADAIDVLETKMLQVEKAKPDTYIYNLLISGCAELGYTKKAFQLYNQMKKRAIPVKSSTYTSLFNACANSPWPNDGLQRAKELKELMIEKGIEMNDFNYHAMIKAFGRCGGLTEAFEAMDEMIKKRITISAHTISFLLQACISDHACGFRRALFVWRKMIELKILPNIFTFNLMLRSARDCGLGDDPGKELAHMLSVETSVEFKSEKSLPLNLENQIEPTDSINILAVRPKLGNLIGFEKEPKRWDKLALMGGPRGFLQLMESANVIPDIKTFALLKDLVPSSKIAEENLINEMKNYGIPIDIDFCNMLMKKRIFYSRILDAKEVLSIISKEGLKPNIITFGVLALGCRSIDDSGRLINDLKESGFRLNIEILGTLMRNGCLFWNLPMVTYILRKLKKEQIKPNKMFIRHINEFREKILKNVSFKEKGMEYIQTLDEPLFEKNLEDLLKAVNDLNQEDIEDAENVHPYAQFQKKQENQ